MTRTSHLTLSRRRLLAGAAATSALHCRAGDRARRKAPP